MRVLLGVAAVASLLICSGCGGSGSGGNPGGPSPPPSSGAPIISIVGDRGAQSFTPNPGSPGVDQTLVWRNNDTVTHRIVLNDSTLDSGDIPPGGSSRAMQLPVAGANYHCTIHPGMIGSVAPSSGGAPPPCTGIYC